MASTEDPLGCVRMMDKPNQKARRAKPMEWHYFIQTYSWKNLVQKTSINPPKRSTIHGQSTSLQILPPKGSTTSLGTESPALET